jgi:glycosyltransferase involved in cell wall biosynthesis
VEAKGILPGRLMESVSLDLSIIIICKNEEAYIGKCIEAVIDATRKIEGKEIIVVDSLSSDRTLTVALQYPVSIYQLRLNWRHTPAAGRYIGFLRSSGQYVLFLDGDSYLTNGFVEKAMEYLQSNRELAAVVGRRDTVFYDGGDIVKVETDKLRIGNAESFVTVTGGNIMFSRAALIKCGCYNPFLYSVEEEELCDRMKQEGYRILAIPFDMVEHNTALLGAIGDACSKVKRKFFLGHGQILRYALARKVSASLLKRTLSRFRLILWAMFGLICGAVSVVSRTAYISYLWTLCSILMFVVFAFKSRSLIKPLKYVVIWIVESYCVVEGFFLTPLPTEMYPTDAVTIKDLSKMHTS